MVFLPLPLLTIDFSIKLIDFLITHECDMSFGSMSSFAVQYQAFVFHHLLGGMVTEVHEEASPDENSIQTTIHHQSLVPRGHLTRGSVSQMLRYIYAPPQNRPRSGNAKQILLLTGDTAAFGNAYVISCMIVFMPPLRYNYKFSSLSLNIILEKTSFQVINYNFIKTVKSEPTFGKSSIRNK